VKLLDAQQVFELHEHVLIRDGGLPGVRLGKSVDAVLARVENNLHFGFDPDVANAAALFAYTFAVGHIFNDANKRTAYVCALITLEINNVKTTKIDQIELEKIIIAAARGDMGTEDFVAAFRELV
jgi:death-on-curing protein